MLTVMRCLKFRISILHTLPRSHTRAAGLLWVDLSFNELGNAGLETVAKAIGDDSPLLILDMRHNCVKLHPRHDDSGSGNGSANGAVPLSALVAPTADGSIGMEVDMCAMFLVLSVAFSSSLQLSVSVLMRCMSFQFQ
jgi:hypothetical protein